MFEILSTIELTVAASIVVALLTHALARTSLSRLTVAGVLGVWFALVLLIGASGALDPAHGLGVPALGLTVGLPVAALLSAFFAVPSIRSAMLATPLPALVAVNATESFPARFLWLSTGRGACRRRSPRAQAGATFSPASRRCRSPGRSPRSARACEPSRSCGIRSGSRTSFPRLRSALYRRRVRFRSMPGRRRPP